MDAQPCNLRKAIHASPFRRLVRVQGAGSYRIAVKHDIRHGLDESLAQAVARKAVEAYAQQFSGFDFRHRWVDDSRVELGFTVTGKRLEGSLSVLPEVLRFELEVPFLLKMFTGKAVDIVEKEAQVWIKKARNGELELPNNP